MGRYFPGAPARSFRPWSWGLAALSLLVPSWAFAETAPDLPPSGGASCSGCHGEGGTLETVPDLAGWPAVEIIEAMTAFRADQRAGTVMNRIAKGFTDDEIRAIAAWLAAAPAKQP